MERKANKSLKRIIKKILVFWLPVVIWLTVIFAFSSRPTKVTSEIYWQDFVVKKLAHIIEYGILTVLIYRALVNSNVEKKEAGFYSIILSLMYGVSDEFHQRFVPGRMPTVRDVFFDIIGAVLAIYFILGYLPRASEGLKNWAKKVQIH